jgi:hypothetical protein
MAVLRKSLLFMASSKQGRFNLRTSLYQMNEINIYHKILIDKRFKIIYEKMREVRKMANHLKRWGAKPLA